MLEPPLAELIKRLTFAIAEPYAHGVVTISRKTAIAILQQLKEMSE
jgi:hypothetical protein